MQNFDALSSLLLPPQPPFLKSEQETSEMEMKKMPKDFIHIQAFMHSTNTWKGREKEAGREKGREGATCCLTFTLCPNLEKSTVEQSVAGALALTRKRGELGVYVMKSFVFSPHCEKAAVGISGEHTTLLFNRPISSQQYGLLQITIGII